MQIVPATLTHALELADNMRPADIREMASTCPGEALRSIVSRAVGVSIRTFAAVSPEGVVCVGGVGPLGNGAGSIWLMGTPHMDSHKIGLAKISRACVDLVQGDYRVVYNHADSRNETHLRWLRWCGFRELPPVTDYTADGVPFIPFFRIKPRV